MKLHINYTENWDEIDDHIKEVEKFFEPLGLQITSSYIPLAELPDSFFESHLSWSGLRIIKTRSIKNSIIKAMGQIKNPDADWYGIYVDKKKVNNAFDGVANAGVLEVYGKRTSIKKYGYNYNVYTFIHEILHLYEQKAGMGNALHEHLQKGGTVEQFRDIIVASQKLEPLLDEDVRAKREEKAPPAQTEIDKSESTEEPYRPNNFILQELVSQKIYNEYGERAWQFFDERLLRNLQWIRDNLGITHVNNWHRGGNLQYRGFDACEYRKDGTSQHNHGRGIDFTVKGKTAQQVNDWIKNNHKTAPEPNMWIEGTLNGKPISHNHLDVRFSDIRGVYEFDA